MGFDGTMNKATQLVAGVYDGDITVGQSLMICLIGLVVVFAVLAILILLIELMHFLLKDRKPAEVETPAAPAAPVERISAGVMAEVPEAADAAKDGDFLAAVSAAIAEATGKPNGSFTIHSIKKG